MKTAFVLAAIVALAAADCVWDLSAADDCSIVDLTLAADGACHAIAGYDEDESAGLSITDDVWTLFENQDCSGESIEIDAEWDFGCVEFDDSIETIDGVDVEFLNAHC